jgi:SAM-dependent methyltransferase
MPADATRRFSDRVADYVRYRPGYPAGLVDTLRRVAGLAPGSVVADVGSGTGLSAVPFLDLGCTVYAVEPNEAMRRAAETGLGDRPGFHSVDGTAEATGLADASVDVVAAGQAFHWFEEGKTRREFARVLRPGGRVALFWNTRLVDATPFLRAYEDFLLRFGTDYAQVDHRHVDAGRLARFFGGPFETHTFPNEQAFDFGGLRGRLLSSSYVPAAGDPARTPMLDELRRLFDRHAEDGRVRVLYTTELHVGRLTPVEAGR